MKPPGKTTLFRMQRAAMTEAERIEAAQGADAGQKAEDNALIGRFGVGFYSAFMVAERVEVISYRAGGDQPWRWSSDGKGAYDVSAADPHLNPPP